jgi:hypothetical protein
MEPRPKKLLDQVRDALRLKHYSIRTENSYVDWIRRYILFHGKRHPNEMGTAEVEAFLTHLAVKGNVAAPTQNQALSALLFLYRDMLHKDLGPIDALRAKKPKRLPTVLTKEEVRRVLGHLSGTHQLMAKLLYGSGLRLMKCLRLRVKDIDFLPDAIVVFSTLQHFPKHTAPLSSPPPVPVGGKCGAASWACPDRMHFMSKTAAFHTVLPEQVCMCACSDEHNFEPAQVFTSLFHALNIFLELRGTSDCSHQMPRSSKRLSMSSKLSRLRRVLASSKAFFVTSFGTLTLKGNPR